MITVESIKTVNIEINNNEVYVTGKGLRGLKTNDNIVIVSLS